MIRITSMKNVGTSGEVWAIVRSLKNPKPGMKQVKALSPSWNLFQAYRKAKDAGQFNADWFAAHYVPQFLEELKANEEAKQLLNELAAREDNITLCCFCTDETLCHRSIIGGLLEAMGATVRYDSSQSYKHYADLL